MFQGKSELVRPEQALPGRDEPVRVASLHVVLETPMAPPFPGILCAMFGMGCFWGAEKIFWEADGVHSTAVGYAAGYTPNPTYQEVCSGRTGHAEVVRVVWDPDRVSYDALLKLFWESHDPTQGMRQGSDAGSQYRSGIYWYDESQRLAAEASRDLFQDHLTASGYGAITTEIGGADEFYYAEDYHQQYLAKNPGGYCGLGGTGVSCPVGSARVRESRAVVKASAGVERRRVAAGQATETQVLLGPEDGAPNFALRRFSMGRGGGMPQHTNTVEHEQYVLRGRARVGIDGEVHLVSEGDVLYIPAGTPHFYEVVEAPFEFLCIVPNAEDRIEILTEPTADQG